jgi:MFS family permease
MGPKWAVRNCGVRSSLRPVAAGFVVFGLFGGAFAVAAIDIERAFDLSDAGLGFLLAAGIVAGTAVAAVGGILTDRWGAGVTLARALLIWGSLLVVEALAPHLSVFAPAFVLAVGAGGLIDVVLNVTAADALSHQPEKLVRFHALWNAACVIGAIAAGVAIRFGGSWRGVWVGIAVSAIVVAFVTSRSRIPEPARVEHPSMWRALVGLRHEGLTVLAVVFAASAMVEGGVATWGVLYLRAHVGLGVLAGVGAYVVGNVLATITRAGSGGIVRALGTRKTVALGASISAAGIAIEVVSPVAFIAAAGLAAASLGISVVWPLLIADVNNEARHPTLAIGGVTAAGYLGMVAGPPIVGLVAGAFGRPTGLMVLAATALFVAVTPAHVRTAERRAV